MTDSREVLGTCDWYTRPHGNPHPKLRTCPNWKPVAPPSAKEIVLRVHALAEMTMNGDVYTHRGVAGEYLGHGWEDAASRLVETAGTAKEPTGYKMKPIAAPTPDAGETLDMNKWGKIAAPVAEIELPPLVWPMSLDSDCDGGLQEREDQLLSALTQLRDLRENYEYQRTRREAKEVELREAQAEIAKLETLLRER